MSNSTAIPFSSAPSGANKKDKRFRLDEVLGVFLVFGTFGGVFSLGRQVSFVLARTASDFGPDFGLK